ncbi:MAG: hypothetical protein J6P61_06545 [Erysipelotrichaceae bacterium]|nr:hypothetical protein [Erysipelotrichaceae bacterium]
MDNIGLNMRLEAYDLAMTFYHTHLWKRIYDSNLFACRLKDGTICYIRVMGYNGKYIGLSVCRGDQGLNKMQKTFADYYEGMPKFISRDMFFTQNDVQCLYSDDDDDYSEEDYMLFSNYCKTRGIDINQYPIIRFSRFEPVKIPTIPNKKEELDRVMLGLKAGIAFAHDMKGELADYSKNDREFPLYVEEDDGSYHWENITVPYFYEEEYKTVPIDDNESIEKIKQIKDAKPMTCGLVISEIPISDDDENSEGHFPYLLLVMFEEENGEVRVFFVDDPYDDNDLLRGLYEFMEYLLELDVKPSLIHVSDGRTLSFFEDFANQLGIDVVVTDEIDKLIDFYDSFGEFAKRRYSDDDEVNETFSNLDFVADELEQWDEERYKIMPPYLYYLMDLYTSDKVDERDLPQIEAIITDVVKCNYSYVISVRFYPGCYRHIKVPAVMDLESLSSFILDAFDIDDNHLHAFFMDNKLWGQSRRACFSHSFVEEHRSGDPTDMVSLFMFDLIKGSEFIYLFDYGDELTFKCKILRIEEGMEAPSVIKRVG